MWWLLRYMYNANPPDRTHWLWKFLHIIYTTVKLTNNLPIYYLGFWRKVTKLHRYLCRKFSLQFWICNLLPVKPLMLVLVNRRLCYLMKQSSDFLILPDYIFLPFCPLGSFFIYHSISPLKVHFVNIYNAMTFYFLRVYNSFCFILVLCVWMSVCMCLRSQKHW